MYCVHYMHCKSHFFALKLLFYFYFIFYISNPRIISIKKVHGQLYAGSSPGSPQGGALYYLPSCHCCQGMNVYSQPAGTFGNVVTIRMISQRDRGELARFYTVTDPKKHQKGYTVYKVTARVSKWRMGTLTARLMLSVVSCRQLLSSLSYVNQAEDANTINDNLTS